MATDHQRVSDAVNRYRNETDEWMRGQLAERIGHVQHARSIAHALPLAYYMRQIGKPDLADTLDKLVDQRVAQLATREDQAEHEKDAMVHIDNIKRSASRR